MDHGDPRHDDERGPVGGGKAAARPETCPGRGRRHHRVGDVSSGSPHVLEVPQVPPPARAVLRDGRVSELPRHGRRRARRPLMRDAGSGRDSRAPGGGLAVGRARCPLGARPAPCPVAGRVLLQDVHPASLGVGDRGPRDQAVGRSGPPAARPGRGRHVAASPLRRAGGGRGRVGTGGRRVGRRPGGTHGPVRRGRGAGSAGGDRRPRPARGDRRVRGPDGGARVIGRGSCRSTRSAW